MLNLYQSKLRLRADPSRVVLRPFHLAWNADVPKERMRKLVDEVRALDMRAARTELALVYHDFESRHLQTQNVFMKRYEEVEADLQLDGRRIREEKKAADRCLFLPRIQLCRSRIDESQCHPASRPG